MIKVKDQNLVYSDKEILKNISEKVDEDKTFSGIGTLSEKKLHKILKYYYEPDKNYHEIKVGGYVADIRRDNIIIEIQSGNFSAMRDKISYYLENYKECKIIVVHPVSAVRHMCWIDKSTGEASKISKSPKFTGIYKFYDQIYFIKDYISNENFNLKLLLLETVEYKFLDGWGKSKKNNASKIEKLPLAIVGEENFTCKNDYLKFIPSKLRDEKGFTAKELGEETEIKGRPAYSFINCMKDAELIFTNSKRGRSICYKCTDCDIDNTDVTKK